MVVLVQEGRVSRGGQAESALSRDLPLTGLSAPALSRFTVSAATLRPYPVGGGALMSRAFGPRYEASARLSHVSAGDGSSA